MSKSHPIPTKVARPESVRYVLLDKERFVELIQDLEAALKVVTKRNQEVSINIDEYNGSFSDERQFVDTLSQADWGGLSTIRVSFADESDRYRPRLNLDFGGYSFMGAGLRITYGSANTDIQRLLIKEKIDRVLEDYRRNVWLDDRVFSIAIAAASFCVLIWICYVISSREVIAKFQPVDHVNLIFVLAGVAVSIYFLVSLVHRMVIPHFEKVTDIKATRLKTVAKLVGVFIGFVGFLGSIFGIIQFLARV